jgi:hypothetical protein
LSEHILKNDLFKLNITFKSRMINLDLESTYVDSKQRYLQQSVRKSETPGLVFQPIINIPDDIQLSSGGKYILTKPNAGGNSIFSEALSFHLLSQMFGFTNDQIFSEMEVKYPSENWKKCDYIACYTDAQIPPVAVSVSRMFNPQGFTSEDVTDLFTKKLCGLVVARGGTDESIFPVFDSSILHIFVYTGSMDLGKISDKQSNSFSQIKHIDVERIISRSYNRLSDEYKSDIKVIVTPITGSNRICHRIFCGSTLYWGFTLRPDEIDITAQQDRSHFNRFVHITQIFNGETIIDIVKRFNEETGFQLKEKYGPWMRTMFRKKGFIIKSIKDVMTVYTITEEILPEWNLMTLV